MDPDAFEEGLLDDTITVVLGGNNKTISIIKPGGKRISDTLVMTLRGKAAKRYETVYESVEKFKCDLLTNMREKSKAALPQVWLPKISTWHPIVVAENLEE